MTLGGGEGAGRPFKTVFALACKFQNRTIQGTVVNRLNGFKFEKDGKKRLNRTVPSKPYRTVYRTFPALITMDKHLRLKKEEKVCRAAIMMLF